MTNRQRIYACFANLAAYPHAATAESARLCAGLLGEESPRAADELAPFARWTAETPIDTMEETYTNTFDINPPCHPYIGHQLFGESTKRSAFLVRLKERYRERGLETGSELPDFLGLALRYLALLPDDETLGAEFVDECVAPAVQAMLTGFANDDGKQNPYANLLRALLTFIAPNGARPLPAAQQTAPCEFVSSCFKTEDFSGGDR